MRIAWLVSAVCRAGLIAHLLLGHSKEATDAAAA